MMIPTHKQADSALNVRSIGARLAQGPWQALPRGLWAVPAVAFLSLVPLPDVILSQKGRSWVAMGVVRAAPDDGERIFG